MTRSERRKLAKAARELASAFAEERGPVLCNGSYCTCAAGEVARRAGYADSLERADIGNEIADLIPLPPNESVFVNLISEATEREISGLRGAVVFPLLALADELESR